MVDPRVEVTRVDRLLAAVAPRFAFNRMAARLRMNYIAHGGGGYEGGKSETKDLQEFNPEVDSAVTDLHPALGKLRSRSRKLVRDSALATGAQALATRSVVGTGLKAEPNPDAQLLGLEEGQAEEWAHRARRLFESWATGEGGCDISREYSFEELQTLVFRGMFEGGDVLVSNRYLPDRGAPFGSCIQLIEPERVSNPRYLPDTHKLAGGVEKDEMSGMVKAYHVAEDHPGETYSIASDWKRVPAWTPKGVRIARLVYRRRRIGERRGEPWLATTIRPLKQIERYTHAELTGAVLNSFFTAFVKQEDPRSNPFERNTSGDLGIVGDPGSESYTGQVYKEKGDIRLRPGLINFLDPGEDIRFPDMSRPNSQFSAFVEKIWQHIGIALGIPYEVLTMRFASSYSASKGALSEAWKTFRAWRMAMVTQFCQPAYDLFLAECVDRGLIDCPGFFDDIVVRRAWSRVRWMGVAPASIDPLKETQAAALKIKTGISTVDQESREMLGTTLAENEAQLRKEAELFRELRPGMYEAEDDDMKETPETRETKEDET